MGAENVPAVRVGVFFGSAMKMQARAKPSS